MRTRHGTHTRIGVRRHATRSEGMHVAWLFAVPSAALASLPVRARERQRAKSASLDLADARAIHVMSLRLTHTHTHTHTHGTHGSRWLAP